MSHEKETGSSIGHPSPEQWMDLLYEEMDPALKTEFQAHIKSCPSCQDQWSAYQKVQAGMNAWKISTPPRVARRVAPNRLWAAAAALALLWAGWSIGQFKGAAAERAAIKKDLQPMVAQWVQEQLTAEREHSREKLDSINWRMDALSQDQLTLLASLKTLRRELETVAILTEENFQGTQEQLQQLASQKTETH